MAVGNLEFIKSVTASSVTSVDITDCFSANYDVYKIIIRGASSTGAGGIDLRFINSSGTTISTANYDRAGLQMRSYGSFIEYRATNDNELQLYCYSVEDGGAESVGYIYNPYSSDYTFSLNQVSSYVDASGGTGWKNIGVLKLTDTITGFNLFNSSVAFSIDEVSVYGLASN